MAIKDDINSIKEELNTQEQFLENMIKSERFFKKYSKFIITAIVLGAIGAIGYYINDAYAKLILNPKDEQVKAELKQKDASLYALYEFKIAVDNNDTSALKSLANEQIDPLLKDIVKSQLNEPSGQILSSYRAAINGYELLKEDKIDEAKNVKFAAPRSRQKFRTLPRKSKMKKFQTILAAVLCAAVLGGCSTKRQYFEPTDVQNEKISETRLPSSIATASLNGAVLKNGMVTCAGDKAAKGLNLVKLRRR